MLNHPDLKDNDQDQEVLVQKKIRHVESFQIEQIEEETIEETMESFDLTKVFQPPHFSYVLPTRRRHILVLDVSQAMNIDRQWEMARNALFRFITHIPEGDEVGIISFGANARINIEPTEVTSGNREGLYGRVPFRLLNGQQGCLECGLKMAIKLLETPRPVANGAIVVLTATSGNPSNTMQNLKAKIEDKALPVYLLAFEPLLNQETVALTSFGASFVVHPGFVLQNLADIFMDILNRGRDLNQRIEKSYQKTFTLEQEVSTPIGVPKRGIAISGNFIVEDNLRSNVWVVLTSPFKEDVEIFEITSPSGRILAFPKYQNGLVYFYMDGLSEAGIWSYKASLYPVNLSNKVNEVTVEVIAQATSTKEETINVEAWTNIDPNIGASVLDTPVIVYAKVTKGQDLPVMNAKVTAIVQRPGSADVYEVDLIDNGTGYPDITNGDGIYSAYFTGFTTSQGLYSLDIRVTHNEGSASTPHLLSETQENLPCCGSQYIPAGIMYTTPTAQFTRYVKASAFYVTQGIEYLLNNGQPEVDDVFPPVRVTDFSVLSLVNNTLYATLKWSAPGSDYDMGQADSYEIRCYTNAEALSETNFGNMGIPVHDSLLPAPGLPGDEQTATVMLPWANEVFYYGLVTLDPSGNRGPVSNLIPVYAAELIDKNAKILDEDVSNVIIQENSLVSSAIRDTFGSQENLVYVLVGSICGFFLVICLICIGVVCKNKQRKAEEKRKQNARTQIFVNDLEANTSGLPDLAPEKPQNYSEVWATHTSGLPNNSSPTNSSLDEYTNMYMNSSNSRNYPPHPTNTVTGYPTMTAYPPNTVPVHEFRSEHTHHVHYPEQQESNDTPTYQNWNHKPPSDNGTATTSSTECYDDHNSDNSHKHNNNSVRVAPLRRYSVDDYLGGVVSPRNGGVTPQDPTPSISNGLSLSPSFCSASEKRRRQESLV